jgi:hypothetical protein
MISGSIAGLAVIARSDCDDFSAEAQRAKAEAIHSDRRTARFPNEREPAKQIGRMSSL